MNNIGNSYFPEDIFIAGTCAEQLFGICKAIWKPNLEPDDLFETISQALMMELKGISGGCEGVVHVM